VLRFKAELAQANTEEALLQEMLGASAVRVVDEPDERESEHD